MVYVHGDPWVFSKVRGLWASLNPGAALLGCHWGSAPVFLPSALVAWNTGVIAQTGASSSSLQ